MDLVEPVFDATSFTQNRDRLLATEVAHDFLRRVVEWARGKGLMSPDHFLVDGTTIETRASHKSFQPKDEGLDDMGDSNGSSNSKGQKRSNEAHEPKTDPDARLARKGNVQPARRANSAHALMENRNGFIVDFEVGTACGTDERDTAIDLIERTAGMTDTLAADGGYDTKAFVRKCIDRGVKPHIARNEHSCRKSAVPADIAASEVYTASMVVRRRIEQIFR
jgi:hypothetical protein